MLAYDTRQRRMHKTGLVVPGCIRPEIAREEALVRIGRNLCWVPVDTITSRNKT
jgi:hypothetical protein